MEATDPGCTAADDVAKNKGGEWLQKRFRVSYEHSLGEGPFYAVYRGLDTKDDKSVAIKIYIQESLPTDQLLNNFREAVGVVQTLTDSTTCRREEVFGEGAAKSGQSQKATRKSFNVGALQKDPAMVAEARSIMEKLDLSSCFCKMVGYSKDTKGNPGLDIESEKVFIVYELGEEPLNVLLDRHTENDTSLSVDEIREIQWSLVAIVCGLHARGYVHFDIRPGHIVRFGTQWKLTDFEGAVKTQQTLPQNRLLMTPYYMSPEIAYAIKQGTADYISASRLMDIWSVGLCALEVVFRQPVLKPWYTEWQDEDGSDDKFISWLADYSTEAIMEGEMKEAMDGISPQMSDMLQQMLVKDPSSRMSIVDAVIHPWFEPLRQKLSKGAEGKRARGSFFSGRKGDKYAVKDDEQSKACAVM